MHQHARTQRHPLHTEARVITALITLAGITLAIFVARSFTDRRIDIEIAALTDYDLTCTDCGKTFERPSACEDEDICQRCGEALDDADDALDVEVV